MLARRALAAAAVGWLMAACSAGDSAGPDPEPAVEAQRWQYAQLRGIRSTFLDSAATGLERPDGYDAAGIELWNDYRDAQLALDQLDSEDDDDDAVDVWIDATKALFAHAYGSGIAVDMVAAEIEQRPSTVIEGSVVPFVDGRPVAVVDIDERLRREGCDGIKREYFVWLGRTNIDEIAGRAGTFARYTLDRAAAAGCDWAVIELTQRALRISGLHAEAAAADTTST